MVDQERKKSPEQSMGTNSETDTGGGKRFFYKLSDCILRRFIILELSVIIIKRFLKLLIFLPNILRVTVFIERFTEGFKIFPLNIIQTYSCFGFTFIIFYEVDFRFRIYKFSKSFFSFSDKSVTFRVPPRAMWKMEFVSRIRNILSFYFYCYRCLHCFSFCFQYDEKQC